MSDPPAILVAPTLNYVFLNLKEKALKTCDQKEAIMSCKLKKEMCNKYDSINNLYSRIIKALLVNVVLLFLPKKN